jgi:hypothetical protein
MGYDCKDKMFKTQDKVIHNSNDVYISNMMKDCVKIALQSIRYVHYDDIITTKFHNE